MTVLIDTRISEDIDQALQDVIPFIIETSLKYEAFPHPCEVSVSIVDNEEIRSINQQFRNIDRPTDVLSFPLLTFAPHEIMDRNELGEVLLGDIIISLEQAQIQAVEYGHSLKREIAFLTAHSMLHLLGYDHMEAQEEKEMFTRQEAILSLAGIPRG